MNKSHLIISLLVIGIAALYLWNSDTSAEKIAECELLSERTSQRFYQWDPFYYKNKCYKDYAIGKMDPTLCLNINHEDSKIHCLAMISGEQKICEQIGDKGKIGVCMSDATLLYKNSQGCANIENERSKDNCYWDNAKLAKDATICLKIDDIQIQNWCFSSATSK
ncbi:MAG: hypothetical protein ABH950_10015 [Candidatus Altiarchaeota archaeon]